MTAAGAHEGKERVAEVDLLLFWLNYSGTEKQYVAYDYAVRLHIGQVECETLIADVIGAIVSNKSGTPPPQFQSCE